MRVIVEAVSGPGKGRQLTLKPGDVIVVGRTEWSDVCIGADQQMSARHFSVESGQNGLRLVDQGSTNGTQVNGEFIKEAPLYDGDQIVAGTTTFRVRIEQTHAAPPTASTPPTTHNAPPTSAGTNPFGEPNPSPYAPVEIGGSGPLGPPDLMASGGNPFDDNVVYTGDSANPKQPPLPRENPIYWEEGPTSVEPDATPMVPPSAGAAPPADAYDSPIIIQDDSPGSVPPPTPPASAPTPLSADTPFGNETPFGSSTPESAAPSQPSAAKSPFDTAPGSPTHTPPPHVPTPPPPPPGYEDRPMPPLEGAPPSSQPTGAAPSPTMPSPASPPPRSDFVPATPVNPSEQRAQPVYDTSRNVTPATADVLQFSMHPCKSSFMKCMRSNFGGAPVEFQPSSIIVLLQRQSPLITLLHFQKAGMDYPQELTEATPLLYWLPDESARNFGPVLVNETKQLDRLATIDALWDSDAALCLFARDMEGATQHLKKLLRYNMHGSDDEEGVFGYCWPSVLSSLLECQLDELVEVIMGNVIDFAFLEVPGQPGNWQIFGREETLQQLSQIGFREVPLEESAQA